MSVVRIELGGKPIDGQHVTFKAPCDCTAITGIRTYYPDGEEKRSIGFTMKDAHGNNLVGIGNLFMTGAYVHMILDTTEGVAYLQNADTNGYLEDKNIDVAHGGTGLKSIPEGYVLVGNGANTPVLRKINAATTVADDDDLVTGRQVVAYVANRLNRTSAVNDADTGYSQYKARAIAISTSVPSSLTNGFIHLTYS